VGDIFPDVMFVAKGYLYIKFLLPQYDVNRGRVGVLKPNVKLTLSVTL